jgi:hypothetical protein
VIGSGLVIASSVATWWLAGDLSTVPPSEHPDYDFRPLNIAAGTARAAGVVSTSVLLIGIALVIVAILARKLRPQWLLVLLPLIGVGTMIGLGWRVMTAGVIGANIGAGLLILFGTPVAILLIAWSIGWSNHLVRRRPHAAESR